MASTADPPRWQRPPSKRPMRQLGALWAGAAVAVLAALPAAPSIAGLLPLCLFKSALGIPCLGCGSTRALIALSRLDLTTAFSLNPLATLAAVAFVVGGLLAGTLTALGRELVEPKFF